MGWKSWTRSVALTIPRVRRFYTFAGEMSATINRLENEMRFLESGKRQLEEERQSAFNRSRKAEEEVQALLSQCDQASQLALARIAELEVTKEQLQTVRQSHQEVSAYVAVMTTERDELWVQAEANQAKVEKLADEASKMAKIASYGIAELEVTKEQYQALRQTYKEVCSHVATITRERDEFRRQAEKNLAELEDLSASFDQDRKIALERIAELEATKEQLQALRQTHEEVCSHVAIITRERAEFRGQAEEKRAELENLSESFDQASKVALERIAELEATKEQLQALRQIHEEVCSHVAAMTKERDELWRQAEENRAELEKLTASYDQAAKMASEQIAGLGATNQQLETERDQLISQIAGLQAQCDQANDESRRLEAQHEEASLDLLTLRGEHQRTVRAREDLLDQWRTAGVERDTALRLLSERDQQYSRAVEKAAAAHAENTHVESSIQVLSAKYEALMALRGTLESRVSRLEQDFDRAFEHSDGLRGKVQSPEKAVNSERTTRSEVAAENEKSRSQSAPRASSDSSATATPVAVPTWKSV